MVLHEAVHGEPHDETMLPLLDPHHLAELAAMAGDGGGAAFLHRVLGLYREHAPPGFAKLRETVAAGDSAASASAAHALKSMSANIGARQAAACFATMEQMSRRDEIPGAALLDQAEAILLATYAEAATVLAAQAPPPPPPPATPREAQPPRRSQNTQPSNAKTRSPCWFTPSLRWNTNPQPGREALGRASVAVAK